MTEQLDQRARPAAEEPPAALGAIEGISDGLAGAARLAGGALADDPERRRTVTVGGYTTTAVLSGLIGPDVSQNDETEVRRRRRRFAAQLLALGVAFADEDGGLGAIGLVALAQGIGLAVALIWLAFGHNPSVAGEETDAR